MKKPKPEQIDIAIQWLQIYEDEDKEHLNEREACLAVAEFLTKIMENEEQRIMIAKIAKEHGVRVSDVKARMKNSAHKQ